MSARGALKGSQAGASQPGLQGPGVAPPRPACLPCSVKGKQVLFRVPFGGTFWKVLGPPGSTRRQAGVGLGCQEAPVHPWSVEGKAGQAFRSQRVSQSRALVQESLFSR